MESKAVSIAGLLSAAVGAIGASVSAHIPPYAVFFVCLGAFAAAAGRSIFDTNPPTRKD